MHWLSFIIQILRQLRMASQLFLIILPLMNYVAITRHTPGFYANYHKLQLFKCTWLLSASQQRFLNHMITFIANAQQCINECTGLGQTFKGKLQSWNLNATFERFAQHNIVEIFIVCRQLAKLVINHMYAFLYCPCIVFL